MYEKRTKVRSLKILLPNRNKRYYNEKNVARKACAGNYVQKQIREEKCNEEKRESGEACAGGAADSVDDTRGGIDDALISCVNAAEESTAAEATAAAEETVQSESAEQTQESSEEKEQEAAQETERAQEESEQETRSKTQESSEEKEQENAAAEATLSTTVEESEEIEEEETALTEDADDVSTEESEEVVSDLREIASGSWDNDTGSGTWSIDEDGVLTIDGTGICRELLQLYHGIIIGRVLQVRL